MTESANAMDLCLAIFEVWQVRDEVNCEEEDKSTEMDATLLHTC